MATSPRAGRRSRRRSAESSTRGPLAAGPLTSGTSRRNRLGLPERGAQDTVLGQLGARDLVGDDAAVEDVDAVAVRQLLVLARVPDEAPPLGRVPCHVAVELALGADVHAPHRVVEQDDPRGPGERAGDQRLLLVAAAQVEDRPAHVGRADVDPLPPLVRDAPLLAGPQDAEPGEQPHEADRDVVADRPEREYALALPVAADVGGRARDPLAAPRSVGGAEQAVEEVALAVAVEPGEPDHLAGVRPQGDAT